MVILFLAGLGQQLWAQGVSVRPTLQWGARRVTLQRRTHRSAGAEAWRERVAARRVAGPSWMAALMHPRAERPEAGG